MAAIPFSAVRHTGLELELATKRACASVGIGQFVEASEGKDVTEVDTVVDNVHCTASDNASNIVNGWYCFDGQGWSKHILGKE